MYKRRRKVTPTASSTLIGESVSNGRLSSQSSLVSTISTSNRSASPEDLFSDSPQKSATNGPSTSKANSSQEAVTSKNLEKKKNTSSDVMHMLLSSDDSEPLVKVPKVTNGIESQKAVLSQSMTTGPLKSFYESLSYAGMVVGRNGQPNMLRKSQFVFIRNLNRELSSNSSKADKFLENLEEYLSDKETLKAALSPTKNHPDANLPGDCLESLVQLLLSLESIQTKLISFLIDRMAEYSVEEDETMVRMILHSMRYLTKVVEPETFTLKLFDLIHSFSNSMLKHEIISCLPEIISDSQREQTANELMELLKSEPHLSPSILFTLSNLWLEPDSLFVLQVQLIKSLSRAALDQLPAFLRFLTSGDIHLHPEIIDGLRSELVICHADTNCTQTKQCSSSELSSTIFLIFVKLRDSVLKSKKLCSVWMKNIEKVKSANKHKPIDILMLLILHCLPPPDAARKRNVESVFKKKIKLGHFGESLIQDTLTVGLVIIKEHFNGLLKLLSSLLLSSDLTVSNFASAFYMECFIRLDLMSRKIIIIELKENIRISKGNAKPGLTLLHSLVVKHPEKVSPFLTLIMLLLDSVEDMRVVEVRELMEVLCTLAFQENSEIDGPSVQDELCMIVQKQLACPDKRIFRSGIVSGVVIIKHMVQVKGNQSNETPSSEQEEIPLSHMAKKALHLLELILLATKTSAEAQVLVFDQLSHIVMTSDNMDKCFMKKISIILQSQLQNHFIITSSEYSAKENGLQPSLQFCIDTDFEDPIVLNLVDAILAESSSSDTKHQIQIPLVALPGLVRVIRGLELADLTEIDALLGCAISLPSPEIYSGFSSLEPHYQNLALDALFHVSNWFREMLNSFVFLIKDGSSEKILKRLRALVYFQTLISQCLPLAISYTPPKYYFDEGKSTTHAEKIIRAPVGRRKKKGKKDDRGDDESVDETALESDEEKEDDAVTLEFSKFKNHLRELDFDACLILTQPLILSPQAIKDGDCSAELGPCELLLLLEDLDAKLRFCLGPRKIGRPKASTGFDNFTSVPTDLIVMNISKLALHLIKHLITIIEYLHNLITVHDGIMDAPGMFGPGTHEIKQCLSLIFSIFNTYISWPDLESDTYMKCLIRSLVKLAGPNFDRKEAVSKNAAAKGALIYLKDLGRCIVDLTSAVGLVNLINTVSYIQDDEDDKFDVGLGSLCGELLQRRWFDGKGHLEMGAKVNKEQTVLLEYYLSTPENINATLEWLTVEVTSGAELTTFPHFTKNNLHILIRSLCKGSLNCCRQRLEKQDPKTQLEIWDGILNNLQLVISVIKVHDSRINLRHFLKGCLPIMRYFLTHGMSVCSTMFKFEPIQVTSVIKKLQVVTRYIQSICNYSKVNKDNSLIHQLPGMRGTLEKILLSVKNMVLQNKCTDAFFMGSMRHKDIHGEIIASQEGEETHDSEEAAPPPEETAATSGESDSAEEAEEEGQEGSMSDTC